MPSKPRIQLQPGELYHILNRGNNRRIIFQTDEEYLHFLSLTKKYVQKIGHVHAYALMDNHFHLIVEIFKVNELEQTFLDKPQSITRTFGHIQNAYAKWYNFRHDNISSLFEKNFERYLVDSDSYYRTVIRYLHYNPINHGVSSYLDAYPYTSYNYLTGDREDTINLISKERVLNRFGSLYAFLDFHRNTNRHDNFDLEF